MDESKDGLFSALMDFSFSRFVTVRVIRILYILSIVLAGLSSLGMLVGGITRGGVGAFVSLVVAPVLFVLMVLGSRVWLEIVVVVFRIAENTASVARALGKVGDAPGTAGEAEGTGGSEDTDDAEE